MKKLIKEPLVHFVLIGIGLFLLYGWVSDSEDSRNTIYFDDYDMDNLIASWEMQWKRLPTDEELKSLVDQNIRQEVFYQEALKMNLDHNDEIIKRRLAQKMNFLSNDLATLKEPTPEDLQTYYEKNKNHYLLPSVYSFYQVSFRMDSRQSARKDAEAFLQNIQSQEPANLENSGDELPFPYFFEDIDADELNRELGLEFSEGIEGLKVGEWSGPIRSGFGWHLIYIEEKTPPTEPGFENISERLKRDLEYENQIRVNDQVYNELKKSYNVEFDLDPEKFDNSFVQFLEG